MTLTSAFHSPVRISLGILLLATSTLKAHADTAQPPRTLTASEFMKVRCHSDSSASYTRWQGTVTTSGPAEEKAQTLFKIVGFNVARCYADSAGNWTVSSRELTYFLDPTTGTLLNEWHNPWTQETLPVVHVANILVQQKIPAAIQIPVENLGETALIRMDVPLSYPNPLSGDPRFADHSPELFYKAHESFTYVTSSGSLRALSQKMSLEDVQVSWTRVSPWLPWMKMKGMPGYLVFNAIVQKVNGYTELPELVRSQIEEKLTAYADAPLCIVSGRPNVTSWSYFKDNFDAYLNRALFPLPAPQSAVAGECR
jgi:hypothetical protein